MKRKPEPRPVYIGLNVTQALKARLIRDAKKAHRTLSDHVRMILGSWEGDQ